MRQFTVLILLATSATCVRAQQPMSKSVPNLIRYNGTLGSAQSAGLEPGTAVGITFAIYKQ